MTDHSEPRREHPSTYVVPDRSNENEFTRVQVQDRMLTASMGGALPEQSPPTPFRRVLDAGCGTGGWLIEMAKTYPTLSLLVGLDVSDKMLTFAREQAAAEHLSDRVEFHAADALSTLQFPAGFFDLVNQRLGISWLRTWDWPGLLHEYWRVTRPGGVIRITESEVMIESGSPARTRLLDLTIDASYRAGHFFTRDTNAVISQLERLLSQVGLQDVQTRAHTLEYTAGTPEGQRFYEDVRLAYRTIIPFLRKWSHVPDDYEAIYQEMLDEIQQPGFVAHWRLLTAWGMKPGR